MYAFCPTLYINTVCDLVRVYLSLFGCIWATFSVMTLLLKVYVECVGKRQRPLSGVELLPIFSLLGQNKKKRKC